MKFMLVRRLTGPAEHALIPLQARGDRAPGCTQGPSLTGRKEPPGHWEAPHPARSTVKCHWRDRNPARCRCETASRSPASRGSARRRSVKAPWIPRTPGRRPSGSPAASSRWRWTPWCGSAATCRRARLVRHQPMQFPLRRQDPGPGLHRGGQQRHLPVGGDHTGRDRGDGLHAGRSQLLPDPGLSPVVAHRSDSGNRADGPARRRWMTSASTTSSTARKLRYRWPGPGTGTTRRRTS
jgi:hypothetical protein